MGFRKFGKNSELLIHFIGIPDSEMEDGMDYKTSLRAKSIIDVSKRKIVNNSQLRIIKYKRHDKRD